MPGLLISIWPPLVGGGAPRWAVRIANVPDLEYAFVGPNLEVQAAWVQAFGEQMVINEAQVAVAALDIDGIAQADAVAQQIFATDQLLLDGEVLFDAAVQGRTLMDLLAEAGQALLDSLIVA